MTAPGEGSESSIAAPADKAEAQSDAIRANTPRVVGKPEPWQATALVLLQRQVREAQANFAAAMQSFAPEGCSLVNGEWVKHGE